MAWFGMGFSFAMQRLVMDASRWKNDKILERLFVGRHAIASVERPPVFREYLGRTGMGFLARWIRLGLGTAR